MLRGTDHRGVHAEPVDQPCQASLTQQFQLHHALVDLHLFAAFVQKRLTVSLGVHGIGGLGAVDVGVEQFTRRQLDRRRLRVGDEILMRIANGRDRATDDDGRAIADPGQAGARIGMGVRDRQHDVMGVIVRGQALIGSQLRQNCLPHGGAHQARVQRHEQNPPTVAG